MKKKNDRSNTVKTIALVVVAFALGAYFFSDKQNDFGDDVEFAFEDAEGLISDEDVDESGHWLTWSDTRIDLRQVTDYTVAMFGVPRPPNSQYSDEVEKWKRENELKLCKTGDKLGRCWCVAKELGTGAVATILIEVSLKNGSRNYLWHTYIERVGEITKDEVIEKAHDWFAQFVATKNRFEELVRKASNE